MPVPTQKHWRKTAQSSQPKTFLLRGGGSGVHAVAAPGVAPGVEGGALTGEGDEDTRELQGAPLRFQQSRNATP